jgi:hypothetical protein
MALKFENLTQEIYLDDHMLFRRIMHVEIGVDDVYNFASNFVWV